ncbi:Poly(A) polymerase central domain-domain-containing protein [Syncephalastrum racemosum]|uniref:Poly(A) polymerase n=1 Tax=Syncephalastrum racemosum TaxID=13706 RepID=A0A1X2HUP3_SYNRA|nr:Poly(A) polymerase central domain-domain-containing protein [Syncephalastrum racemosum]
MNSTSKISKQFGVTGPLSTAESSERDHSLLAPLEALLKRHGMYESQSTATLRLIVLQQIETLTVAFVREACTQFSRTTPDPPENLGGKVYPFGSCRLGVQAEDADLDAICVFPSRISREQFFDGLCSKLELMQGVQDVLYIKNAFVPIIKFKCFGISVDLLCASLPMDTVPDDLDVDDSALLMRMDGASIRSLNGTRVADSILNLVPDIDTFRTAVRCIKLWAMRRAIYSNVVGFPGGVAWAIMVARVCQFYPKACASTVVSKFFNIIARWVWPQPVMLCHQEEQYPLSSEVQSWDPKRYLHDRQHRMPVITPCFPYMCATHNITSSSLKIITGEAKRAAAITDRIMLGKADWDALFEENSFFSDYRHYIQVITSAYEPLVLKKWAGFVESILRHLNTLLENTEGVDLAQIYTDAFDESMRCTSAEEVRNAAKGEPFSNSGNADSTCTVHLRSFYIGIQVRRTAVFVEPKQLDLTWPIDRFLSLLRTKNAEKLKGGVFVKHIRG